jgi:leucyl aminopeptidase
MQVSVRSTALSTAKADLVAIAITEMADRGGKTKRLPPSVAAFDRAHGDAIRALVDCGDFSGKSGESALVYASPKGKTGAARRVLLLGIGDASNADANSLRRLAGAAVKRAIGKKATSLALAVPKLRGIKTATIAQALAEGVVLGAYRFDQYKEKSDTPAPRSVTLLLDGATDLRGAKQAAADGVVLGESQNLARDLSNEPPNVLTPVKLASVARATARKTGMKCKVLDVKQMEALEMGAILAVGRGSVNPPRMIILEHTPKKRTRKTKTICIVGKGITFDTGGISIKPSGNMHEMKHDMSGAAAVLGAMRAVALLDLPLHVVGVMAAAENMPDGKAYRPGDVIRAMNGKTIEILNTDAEGRVVLADALHYAATQYKPEAMVDLATLTGACVVALGSWASALLTRDDKLAAELQTAGENTGEILWRLPLFDEHEKAMKSKVADLQNAGARDAGTSTAAGFLASFSGPGPWAHLDIAGTAWGNKSGGYDVSGASGVGVRALLDWLQTRARKR